MKLVYHVINLQWEEFFFFFFFPFFLFFPLFVFLSFCFSLRIIQNVG